MNPTDAKVMHTATGETYAQKLVGRGNRPAPDLVTAAQRKRAAEIELMLDLQRELIQGDFYVAHTETAPSPLRSMQAESAIPGQ